MQNYKYKAVSGKGQIVEGHYMAQSEQEIITILKDNNYFPISVEEIIETQISKNLFIRKPTQKDMAIFCEQFYIMLNSGIGIVQILEILERQTKNKVLKKTIGFLYEDVQKGMALSEGMKKHKEVFPNLLVNMAEAGETSGNLDVIMKRMATHFEREHDIENSIKNALMYPKILCVVSIFVITFLLMVVMPTFIGMFDNSGVPLPGPTRLLLSIGNSLKDHGILIIAIIIILILSVKVFKKSERGENFFDSLKIRIPGIKAINIKIITSRFTRTLSTLISSGIPLLEALEIVSRIVDNKIIHNKIQLAKQDIQKGMSLSEAVETLGIFPTMVVPMIRVGEESGALDELLYKTADFYDIEIETSMEKINFLLEPILIIFMGIIIGFIIIAMTLPMFDLINTIEM